MGARKTSHEIEEKGIALVHSRIANLKEYSAAFRELTGRDYGVDGIVELFENQFATGCFALIQIKSTSQEIKLLRHSASVAINISPSSAHYAYQNRIPFVVIYCSIGDESAYYKILNGTLGESERRKVESGKQVRIRIPTSSKMTADFSPLIEAIKGFYQEGV